MPGPGGLEDLVLSALVREQLEGIVPEALALMTPKKMAVSPSCWSRHSFIHSFFSHKHKKYVVIAELPLVVSDLVLFDDHNNRAY